jgi:hypothetical protein
VHDVPGRQARIMHQFAPEGFSHYSNGGNTMRIGIGLGTLVLIILIIVLLF